jgi:hypothetical protein
MRASYQYCPVVVLVVALLPVISILFSTPSNIILNKIRPEIIN